MGKQSHSNSNPQEFLPVQSISFSSFSRDSHPGNRKHYVKNDQVSHGVGHIYTFILGRTVKLGKKKLDEARGRRHIDLEPHGHAIMECSISSIPGNLTLADHWLRASWSLGPTDDTPTTSSETKPFDPKSTTYHRACYVLTVQVFNPPKSEPWSVNLALEGEFLRKLGGFRCKSQEFFLFLCLFLKHARKYA